MKHFRLYFILLLALIVALTATAVLLTVRQLYPQAIFVALGVIVMCAILWNLTDNLKRVVWTFAKSLEVRDTTTTFDTDTDDPVLSETLTAFNNLIALFHSTTMELETRKLYYDRILKIMSHEMGNSITPVIALCSDIKKHPDRYHGDRLNEAIDLIDSRSRGISRFLKAYYNLTHLPEPQTVQIDSREFIRLIKQLTDAELHTRGLDSDIIRFTTSAVVTLDIDTDLMSQVIVNLTRNALDAVSNVANPAVSFTVSTSDGHPYIIIEDNGHGIDPAIRDDLFQPFVTTKPDGTGVGLYISRQIVRRHGGDLRLYSTPGSGTKAVIELRR